MDHWAVGFVPHPTLLDEESESIVHFLKGVGLEEVGAIVTGLAEKVRVDGRETFVQAPVRCTD